MADVTITLSTTDAEEVLTLLQWSLRKFVDDQQSLDPDYQTNPIYKQRTRLIKTFENAIR